MEVRCTKWGTLGDKPRTLKAVHPCSVCINLVQKATNSRCPGRQIVQCRRKRVNMNHGGGTVWRAEVLVFLTQVWLSLFE